MNRICIVFLLVILPFLSPAQRKDTFDVFFPLNDTKLNKSTRDYVDKLIFNDSLIHGQQFMILGYADYLGGDKYNEILSSQRATRVKEYLVAMGFTANDITICIGKGKINRDIPTNKEGMPADRKVQIIITTPPVTAPAPTRSPSAKTAVLDMSHLAVNQSVALKNILFEGDRSTILSSSIPELDNLYNFLNHNTTVSIRIEGHVCCAIAQSSRDSTIGMELSFERAKAVYDYLVSKGISKSRLTYKGFGISHPAVFPAITPQEQEQNRRVEVRITGK